LKTIYSHKYALMLRLLIDARKAAGLTQSELADIISKRQTFVSKYERGERRLDVLELIQIARCLNIDPHAIIDEIENSVAPESEGSK
jgi:transcriptional regulator with XRE-family HTH domain